ncbi:hypothetical protein GPECTOR_19g262 [Gonium pectorale]|uniref:Protein kinase domain-containing protein n=1 Tax=Gonium pectorale TaxID=33097 RepID=A0A150GJ26_GONPE|nr:hypothetical protein GPECTOR_19g262 [Gonium pectorale]|eukprot:KXZ49811.1 hypothetical protein GPECTOR_19g262 [Gonium pectorale]
MRVAAIPLFHGEVLFGALWLEHPEDGPAPPPPPPPPQRAISAGRDPQADAADREATLSPAVVPPMSMPLPSSRGDDGDGGGGERGLLLTDAAALRALGFACSVSLTVRSEGGAPVRWLAGVVGRLGAADSMLGLVSELCEAAVDHVRSRFVLRAAVHAVLVPPGGAEGQRALLLHTKPQPQTAELWGKVGLGAGMRLAGTASFEVVHFDGAGRGGSPAQALHRVSGRVTGGGGDGGGGATAGDRSSRLRMLLPACASQPARASHLAPDPGSGTAPRQAYPARSSGPQRKSSQDAALPRPPSRLGQSLEPPGSHLLAERDQERASEGCPPAALHSQEKGGRHDALRSSAPPASGARLASGRSMVVQLAAEGPLRSAGGAAGGSDGAGGTLHAKVFPLQHTLLQVALAQLAAHARASSAASEVADGEPGGQWPAAPADPWVVQDTRLFMQDVHQPSGDVCLLMRLWASAHGVVPGAADGAGGKASGGAGAEGDGASPMTAPRSIALLLLPLAGGGALGLYLCFSRGLPGALLRAVQRSGQELVAKMLGGVMRAKLELDPRIAAEHETLCRGNPGSYAVLHSIPGTPSSAAAADQLPTHAVSFAGSAKQQHQPQTDGGLSTRELTAGSAGGAGPAFVPWLVGGVGGLTLASGTLSTVDMDLHLAVRHYTTTATVIATTAPTTATVTAPTTETAAHLESPDGGASPALAGDHQLTAVPAAAAASIRPTWRIVSSLLRLPGGSGGSGAGTSYRSGPSGPVAGASLGATSAAARGRLSLGDAKSAGAAGSASRPLSLVPTQAALPAPPPGEACATAALGPRELPAAPTALAPLHFHPAPQLARGITAPRPQLQLQLEPGPELGPCAAAATTAVPSRPSSRASFITVDGPDTGGEAQRQLDLLMSSITSVIDDEPRVGGASECPQGDLDALRLGGALGRGGFGTVYLGRLGSLDVAVKVIQLPALEPAAALGSGAPGPAPAEEAQPQSQPQPLASARARAGARAVARLAEAAAAAEQLRLNARRELLRNATELAVLSRISHPNVVQVYGIYNNVAVVCEADLLDGAEALCLRPVPTSEAEDGGDGGLVLPAVPSPPPCVAAVMELCDRGSLAAALALRAFPWVAAAEAAADSWGLVRVDMRAVYLTLLDVALALRYLHSCGLVHRDIKTANLLLRSSPRDPRGFTVKLADFGFVMRLNQVDESGARYAIADQACGTVTHIAPEALLKRARIDAAVDVYSFGILMWEMFACGARPYQHVATDAVGRCVAQGLRPVLAGWVPPAYRSLAMACWQTDRRRRPRAADLVSTINMRLQELASLEVVDERGGADRPERALAPPHPIAP